MAIGFGEACPKPMTRKRVKGRKDRAEAKVKKSVRAQCVDRDGYCRVAHLRPNDLRRWNPEEFPCWGFSEWAHLCAKKRFKTRGQEAATRHTIWGSVMLCHGHHEAYDRARMTIHILTPFGADGPLGFKR